MKKPKYDFGADVRAIARERVGAVRPRLVMVPKILRKPKYKEVY